MVHYQIMAWIITGHLNIRLLEVTYSKASIILYSGGLNTEQGNTKHIGMPNVLSSDFQCFSYGPDHSKTEKLRNQNKMAAILFEFPMVLDKMADNLIKTKRHWKTKQISDPI